MGFPYDGNAKELFQAIGAVSSTRSRVLPLYQIHHVYVDLVLGDAEVRHGVADRRQGPHGPARISEAHGETRATTFWETA